MPRASETVLTKLPRLRKALQWVLLFVVLVCGLVPVPAGTLRRALGVLSGGAPSNGRPAADPAVFWFDPSYGPFLEAVADRTAPESTHAVVAPAGELYVYGAAYALAPRRVVFPPDIAGARAVAYYRPRTVIPGSEPLPNGALLRK